MLYVKLDDSAKSEYGPRFVFETAENFAAQQATKSSPKKKGGKKKENKEEIPQDSGQICL